METRLSRRAFVAWVGGVGAGFYLVGRVPGTGAVEALAAIPGGRVDPEAGRLIDDHEMLVFENNLERNVLRFIVRRFRLGNGQRICFAAFDLCCGVANLAFGQGAASDQRLQPLAGERRHRNRKGAIEPPAGLRRLQPYIDDLLPPGHCLGYGVNFHIFNVRGNLRCVKL